MEIRREKKIDDGADLKGWAALDTGASQAEDHGLQNLMFSGTRQRH